MKKILSTMLALSMSASIVGTVNAADLSAAPTSTITYNYDGENHTRQMESLGRGLVAIKTDSGVFLSWRLLDNEDVIFGSANANTEFKIYRNNTAIATVTDVTNYTDTTVGTSYSVAPVINGVEGEKCAAVSVNSNNYFDIPLTKPADETITQPDGTVQDTYSFFPADCSTGDVDGDGEYEIIVKWTSSERDVGSPGDPAYSGTVRLAAYKLDGTKLWANDINLGRNVYSSAHTVQFLVYDFDLDGKSEVMCQTSLGSTDSSGAYVSHSADPVKNSTIYSFTDTQNAEADYRGYGRITSGEEFLTIFNGETGNAIDTIDLPTARIAGDNGAEFGDDFGNRSNRFVSDVAYLDGEKPYAVYLRGYYFGRNGQQRTSIAGISFDGERLSPDYRFDTLQGQEGYYSGAEQYVGQGNHNCTVADVDDDGKDEFITGALCMEVNDSNQFRPRWCTFLEHGDALHIGDYDPTHKGFEFFTVHEDTGTNTMSGTPITMDYGMSVIDADTGEIIFHEAGSADTGRGVMANIGMGGYYQIWSAKNDLEIANGGTSFTKGSKTGLSQNFRIFWDGDLYDNLLDGTSITDWSSQGISTIFNASAYECVQINGTKANPCLQADLFGDWREEVVYPTSLGDTLRVFTTTTPTSYKIKTLMHDPVYRSGVAAEQTAYNQPPHVGFYLSDETFKPEISDITVQSPSKTIYKVGEALDTSDMVVTANYIDGTSITITNYVLSGYNSMAAGTQSVTVAYSGISKSFNVTVVTGFECNSSGVITNYSGSESSATIPDMIDGIIVTGIAENALINSSLTDVYVSDSIETIGANSFHENTTLHCYEGSAAHIYALENNLKYQLIEREMDYIANVDFSEDEYNLFQMVQAGTAQSKTVNGITYNVGGRSKGGGDGQTGFRMGDNDGNIYLCGSVGRFSNSGRNSYITLSDAPYLADTYDAVLSMKIMIPDDGYAPYANLVDTTDENNIIDTISTSNLNINRGTWYNYSLIYHNGVYYRVLSDTDGSLLSFTKLTQSDSDSFVSRIDFLAENRPGNNLYTYVGIDDFQLYTTESAISDIAFVVTDTANNPIENAKISIFGSELKTDSDGYAEIILPSGLYDAQITADGYVSKTIKVAAQKASIIKKVALEIMIIPAQGLALDKSEISLIPERSATLKPIFTPANTTNQNVSWTSSDSSIATVTNGVVTAVKPGTAKITATSQDGSFTAECTVTVYDNTSYTPVAASIKITQVPASAYIPLSGINNVKFSAEVYDQYGIPMNDAEITWTTNNESITVDNGIVSVPFDTAASSVIITAACGTLTDSAELILSSMINVSSVYADLSYTDAPTMTQTTQYQSVTADNVTYFCNARNDNGDGYSGIVAKDGYIIAQAGKWSTSARNSGIIFDIAPSSYSNSLDYVFETDIYIPESYSSNAEIRINNGTTSEGTTIDLISAAGLGISTNKWYKYQLIYSDGSYTRYIYDTDNNIVSVSSITASAIPVSRLDFCTTNAANAQVYLDNTKYYSTDSAVSDITVKVRDNSGNNISGITVSIGNVKATTNNFGNAAFTLPSGIYTASISDDQLTGSVTVYAAGEKATYVLNALSGYSVDSVSGSAITLTASNADVCVIASKYDNGRLSDVAILHPDKAGTITLNADFAPNKVFIWSNDYEPLAKWSK